MSVFPSLFFVISLVSSGLSSKRSSKLVLLTFVSAFHCCLGCFLPTIDHGLCHLCTLNKSIILLVFSLQMYHTMPKLTTFMQYTNESFLVPVKMFGTYVHVLGTCFMVLWHQMKQNFDKKIIKERKKCIVSIILYYNKSEVAMKLNI